MYLKIPNSSGLRSEKNEQLRRREQLGIRVCVPVNA